MANINDINKMLRELNEGGVFLPSASSIFRTGYFSPMVTTEGYINTLGESGLTPIEYSNRLEKLLNTFPEMFDEQTILQKRVEKFERLIINYNKTVPKSEQLPLTFSTAAMLKAEKALASSNIYDPEFGRSLREIFKEQSEDIRGGGGKVD